MPNRMISKEITGYNIKGSCETIWRTVEFCPEGLFPSIVSKSQVQMKSKVTPAFKFPSQLLAGFRKTRYSGSDFILRLGEPTQAGARAPLDFFIPSPPQAPLDDISCLQFELVNENLQFPTKFLEI